MAGDLENLPGRARTAAHAVNEVSRAFEDLSKTGKLSFQTLESGAGVLLRINPALGLVAAGGLAVYHSFKAISDLEFQEQVNLVNVGLKVQAQEFNRNIAAITGAHGKTGELGQLYKQLAVAQFNLADTQRQWNEELQKASVALKENKETVATEEARMVALKQRLLEKASAEQADVDKIQAQIEATKDLNKLLGEEVVITADAVTELEKSSLDSFMAIGDMIASTFSQIGKPAFDAYTAAIYDMAHAHTFASGTIVKALGKQVRDSIKAVGEEAAVRALFEGAMALASFAIGDAAGGTAHATSAAEFALTAAEAGIVVAAIGGKSFAGGAPTAGAGGGGGGMGSGGSGQSPVNVTVTVIGTLDSQQAEDLHYQISQAAANRGL